MAVSMRVDQGNRRKCKGEKWQHGLDADILDTYKINTVMSKHSDTVSNHSEDGDDSGDDQLRLLQLLNAQCAASLGGAIASTSRLDDSEDEDDSQDDAVTQSGDDEDDDEWAGFSGMNDVGPSAAANSKKPLVVSFEDGLRKRKFEESEVVTFGEKDNFMVCSILLVYLFMSR